MLCLYYVVFSSFVFFFKQKTAYEMRISDWSSDVCSSDLEGGRVAIADLNIDAAEKAAAEIREKSDAQVMAVAMDVTSEEQVNEGVDKVVSAWGTVDVLVSNAGIQIVNPVEQFADRKSTRLNSSH